MNPWIGNAVFLAGFVASIAIRHPYESRSHEVKVAESRKGGLERALLALMVVGHLVLPVVFMATSWLSFADYPLHPAAVAAGSLLVVSYLWLFRRAHADLGDNWSVSLELREEHRLVASGVYGKIRHPMYAAIFLMAITQTLLLANRVAGPACLVAFGLMFLLRFRAEERLMVERFGKDYEDYMTRTKRLIPGVW